MEEIDFELNNRQLVIGTALPRPMNATKRFQGSIRGVLSVHNKRVLSLHRRSYKASPPTEMELYINYYYLKNILVCGYYVVNYYLRQSPSISNSASIEYQVEELKDDGFNHHSMWPQCWSHPKPTKEAGAE